MTAAVLFDFGGTLDADGTPWKERFFHLCRSEGAALPPEQFDPVFYAADDAIVGAVPATLSLEDTVARLAAGVTRGLRPGGDDALAGRLAAAFLRATRAQVDLNRPLLTRLAARYRLGIVSNFYGNLTTVCEDLHIRALFDVIVDSTRVGLTKPDPRIFRAALDALGIGPADAVFVGDSAPRDMAGARAVGMPHIWLTGDAGDGRTPCCTGDRSVRSLGELEALLL